MAQVDMLSKQLMLARQSTNITKIAINQNTLQPRIALANLPQQPTPISMLGMQANQP